jgi:hypothetical protein
LLIGYGLFFHSLMKGWLGFLFKTYEDACNIMEGKWYCGLAILSLKIWYVCFESCLEVFKGIPIWVKLLGIPLELCKESIEGNQESFGENLGC